MFENHGIKNLTVKKIKNKNGTIKIEFRALFLNLDFYVNFLDQPRSSKLYNHVKDTYYSESKNNKRESMFFGDPKTVYVTNYGKVSSTRPVREIDEEIDYVRGMVEEEIDKEITVVLSQYYPNGKVGIKPHQDREMVNKVICGLSLGETRTLNLIRNGNFISLKLNPGSLYVLDHPTNDYYFHSIVEDKTINPRISLTFRECH